MYVPFLSFVRSLNDEGWRSGRFCVGCLHRERLVVVGPDRQSVHACNIKRLALWMARRRIRLNQSIPTRLRQPIWYSYHVCRESVEHASSLGNKYQRSLVTARTGDDRMPRLVPQPIDSVNGRSVRPLSHCECRRY